MSRILPFALVFLLVAPSDSIAHRHKTREVATSFAQAWSQHNVAELADLFAEDGSFTHPFAASSQSLVAGRSSLESFLKALFSVEMGKSSYVVKESTIRERQIGPAFVIEFEATLTGAATLSGSLDHRATMVLERAKGVANEPGAEKHPEHWSIAALSLVTPAPGFAARNAPGQ